MSISKFKDMKRILWLFACISISGAIYAQEYKKDTLRFDEYKNVFNGRKVGSVPWQIGEVFEILDLDIFSYYDLDYETELQRKVFLESEEGKKLTSELKEKRNEVLSTNSLVVYEFYFWGKEGLDDMDYTYDLDRKVFREGVADIKDDRYPELLLYRNLLLRREGKVKSIETMIFKDDAYLGWPMSAEIALDLENSIRTPKLSRIDIVWELRIEGSRSRPDLDLSDLYGVKIPLSPYIVGTVANVYLIDAETHEVYYSLDEERWAQELKRRQLERLEREKRRLEEEKRRLEEEERKQKIEAERREKINSFLADRQNKIYEMPYSNRMVVENRLQVTLQKALEETFRFSGNKYKLPGDMSFSVKDIVTVSYSGSTNHLLDVEFTTCSNNKGKEEIKKAIENSFLATMFPFIRMQIPGTDTLCVVSSRCVYEASVRIVRSDMTVKLSKSGEMSLKKGDARCYEDNVGAIKGALSRYKKGVYDIAVFRKMIDGKFVGADAILLDN